MDATPTAPAVRLAGRPIFVLGERAPAMDLVWALGATPTLCAMPANRLLADLVAAVERGAAAVDPAVVFAGGEARPARWYGEVQAAWLELTGKARTVEFSGLSVLRLCELFPSAQFVVVRPLRRAIAPSRRLPELGRTRILEVDSGSVTAPVTLERVRAFLGEPAAPVEIDLSEERIVSTP